MPVNFAICGLGRIGRLHALNILKKIGTANVIAGCLIIEDDLTWAQEKLPGIALYKDFEEMLNHPGIDAVLIASSTLAHSEQAIKAIQHNYHVLCEKPLATNVADAQKVADTAKKHPHLKVLCGFSRRFDSSYIDAHEKVTQGFIGTPTVFRSQTCDKQDNSGFFVEFAKKSGGIFVDCLIHDIDLCLHFFGDNIVPKKIFAVGNCSIYPGLAQYGDTDNALGLVEFQDGRIANFYATRMMTHGQEDVTEIIEKGKLTVNKNAHKNLVTISDEYGIRQEVPDNFWGRFELAFINELTTFTNYILKDQPVPFSLDGNVKVLQWAQSLQNSLQTGKAIYFDENGDQI